MEIKNLLQILVSVVRQRINNSESVPHNDLEPAVEFVIIQIHSYIREFHLEIP